MSKTAPSSSPSRSGGGGLFRFGIGPAILVGAAWIIFWNEGGAAKTEASLNEGARSVVSVSPTQLDPANEGKLVHVIGEATTTETLADADLHVSVSALKLKRVAEMYQWVEASTQQEGPPTVDGKPGPPTTTYQHLKEWKADFVNSAIFKQPAGHANPPALLFQGAEWQAEKVTLGEFELTSNQKAKLHANTPLQLVGEQGQVSLSMDQGKLYRDDKQLLIRPDLAGVAKRNNLLKFTSSTAAPTQPPDEVLTPQIGDVRVQFLVSKPQEITVLGKQVGNQILPYQSQTGRELSSFLTGHHTAESIFQSALSWSTRGTWFFRGISLLIVYFGLFITLAPLTMHAASTGWLQPLVARGMFYVRASLTVAITALLVGAAWFYYRPAWAIGLFAVGGLFLVGTVWLVWRFSKARPQER